MHKPQLVASRFSSSHAAFAFVLEVLGRPVRSSSRMSDHFRNLCTISGTHSRYTVTTHLKQVTVNSCGGTCSFHWNRITLGNSLRDQVSNISASAHSTYPINSFW